MITLFVTLVYKIVDTIERKFEQSYESIAETSKFVIVYSTVVVLINNSFKIELMGWNNPR